MKCERCGKAVSNVEWDIHTCTPPAQPTTETSSAAQSAAQPAPVQEQQPYAYANPDELSADSAFRWCEINEYTMPVYTTPPAAPVQSLPFGVGGGLVAIRTLLSRDPCVHANTAIEMLDAILKGHPAAQPPLQDIPDLIAGAFGVSRGTAYDLMRDALKEASPAAQPRTDQQIVDQTEELAVWLLLWRYNRQPETDTGGAQMRESTHPFAERCWAAACHIQEMLTATDPENAVSELDVAPEKGGAA